MLQLSSIGRWRSGLFPARFSRQDSLKSDARECFPPPSDRVLANSVHLLEGAGIPAPDFAQAGPVEADVYLSSVTKRFGELNRSALQDRFTAANDTDSQARLLSCGGIGAQWLVSLPADPRLAFTDEDFVSVVRFRLGFDVFTTGRCPHVNADLGLDVWKICENI